MTGYSRNWQNRANNDHGRMLEQMIEVGCNEYRVKQLAMIEKTPEPFRVKKINSQSKTFTAYFTGKAQPDFKGTLKGGRAICFEAKMTTSDKLKKDVVTPNQSACLDMHAGLGALCGVCCMIKHTVAFVPWNIWENMKNRYGRKYMTESEIKEFEVPTPVYADFLFRYKKDLMVHG